MTARTPRYILTFLFCITLTGMYGQRYPGEGGDFSRGTGSQFQNVGLPKDSIEAPPLRKQYMAIHHLGYLNRIVDSVASRSLSSDLQFDQLHNARLGNIFSATLPVEFKADHAIGAKIGINSYRSYQDQFPVSHIIAPNRPLVTMEYGTRFGDGQRNIGIDFNRTFARDIVLDFNAYSGTSDGQYANQKSSYNRLELSLVRKGNKKIRDSYLHFSVYRNGEEVNGGLTDQSVASIGTANSSIALQRSTADLQLKTTNFKAGTSYKLGVDSIASSVDKYLFAEIGSSRDNYRYYDRNFQSDSLSLYSPFSITNDTIDTQLGNLNIYEKIGFRVKKKGTNLTGALQFIQNSIIQDSLANIATNQIFLTGQFNTSLLRNKISITAYQELGNTSENKYEVSISRKWKSHSFNGSITTLSEASSIMANQLSINGEQQWTQKYANEKYTSARISYTNTNLRAKVELAHNKISNYIYVSPDAFSDEPSPSPVYKQLESPISISSIKFNQKLNLWIFRLDNTIYAQSIDRIDILGLPKFSSRHDISLYLNLFKKNLQVQAGAVLWYQDRSVTAAFNPLLNEFYVPDEVAGPRYFRVMPYLRATIDSFEFFVGADNLYNQLLKKDFFAVRNYLELDSRINLAFRWRLLD